MLQREHNLQQAIEQGTAPQEDPPAPCGRHISRHGNSYRKSPAPHTGDFYYKKVFTARFLLIYIIFAGKSAKTEGPRPEQPPAAPHLFLHKTDNPSCIKHL